MGIHPFGLNAYFQQYRGPIPPAAQLNRQAGRRHGRSHAASVVWVQLSVATVHLRTGARRREERSLSLRMCTTTYTLAYTRGDNAQSWTRAGRSDGSCRRVTGEVAAWGYGAELVGLRLGG